MPTSATGPIRRPGQRSADPPPTSAIVDNIASELALAPAIPPRGAPWDPVVPAATNTQNSPNPRAEPSAIANTRPALPGPPGLPRVPPGTLGLLPEVRETRTTPVMAARTARPPGGPAWAAGRG